MGVPKVRESMSSVLMPYTCKQAAQGSQTGGKAAAGQAMAGQAQQMCADSKQCRSRSGELHTRKRRQAPAPAPPSPIIVEHTTHFNHHTPTPPTHQAVLAQLRALRLCFCGRLQHRHPHQAQQALALLVVLPRHPHGALAVLLNVLLVARLAPGGHGGGAEEASREGPG